MLKKRRTDMTQECNKKGMLFVVSAPSGGGKGTILKRVFNDPEKVHYSVSATTRAPRDEDKDGVTYHFMSKEKFQQLIDKGEFLEYAEYCGNYYGTLKSEVTANIESGKDVLLEIETKGAFNIKNAMPEAVLIFIIPPSMKELRRRLTRRGTEDEETINKRMEQAANEIRLAEKYDHIIINGDLDEAALDLAAVCKAARIKRNAKNIIDEVLKNA